MNLPSGNNFSVEGTDSLISISVTPLSLRYFFSFFIEFSYLETIFFNDGDNSSNSQVLNILIYLELFLKNNYKKTKSGKAILEVLYFYEKKENEQSKKGTFNIFFASFNMDIYILLIHNI